MFSGLSVSERRVLDPSVLGFGFGLELLTVAGLLESGWAGEPLGRRKAESSRTRFTWEPLSHPNALTRLLTQL